MGVKRIVDVSFWTDGKVDDFSPEDKYFMLYLLTCPFTTQLGIYEISIKQAAFHLGYSTEAVNVLIDRFENKYGMIRYSKGTHEIAIKNYLRHSIVKGGAPVRDCLIKEIKSVKDRALISWVFSCIKGMEDLNETVKSLISEYEEKNGILYYCKEKQNENENENENDVSYHDTNNDSLNESLKPKPVKHKYGEYKNVLLTDDELDKLKTEYSDWQERIERLSSYVASTGKRYKSHYATIRNWAKKDKEQQKQPVKKNGFHNFKQRDYDFAAMERILLNQENPPKTAGNDEGIKQRAEDLQKRIMGVYG